MPYEVVFQNFLIENLTRLLIFYFYLFLEHIRQAITKCSLSNNFAALSAQTLYPKDKALLALVVNRDDFKTRPF